MNARTVESVHPARPASDGAGVRLFRNLAPELQSRLDPFLLLDEFGSDRPDDYIAGFPDHPHRGFETITYLLAGSMLHRDSRGNEGRLESGDVQWMTAARGVIHSEMPQQEEGLLQGFQLWLNLPAARKMDDPWYRDLRGSELGRASTGEGVEAVVVAGSFLGASGPGPERDTEPLYVDLRMPAGTTLAHALPDSHRAFLYVYEGRVDAAGSTVEAHHLAVLSNAGDGVELAAPEGARLLLIAGKPVDEPIVQMGPFVMNSRREIEQAFDDYRSGRLTS